MISHKDQCAKTKVDAEYFIAEGFGEKLLPSGSGAYRYRSGCPFWIGEFSMNSLSNSYIDPQSGKRIKKWTIFGGLAYDLPSSAKQGGSIPTVAEDCNRLRVQYFVYTKMKHEPAFVFRKEVRFKGVWAGSGCNYVYFEPNNANAAAFKLKAPDANVLVIRVAVRVKERNSWQEAAAFAGQGPAD